MAGNKILPFGTAYSAMCRMIYDSININWWWWSRITQTSGSSVELFSYLPHLPPRQTSAQKCRLFCLTQNWSLMGNICSPALDQKLGKGHFCLASILKTVKHLSLSFSLLPIWSSPLATSHWFSWDDIKQTTDSKGNLLYCLISPMFYS